MPVIISNITGVVMKISSKSAFTVIELVVVISIITILASLAVPNFRTVMESIRFSGAVNRVRADLLRAKILAIQTKDAFAYTVAFNYTDNNICGADPCDYIIFADKDMDGSFDADDDKLVKFGVVKSLSALYPGVVAFFNFPSNRITFKGDFKVSNGGSIQIQMAKGNKCKIISITPVVGRIGEPEGCT